MISHKVGPFGWGITPKKRQLTMVINHLLNGMILHVQKAAALILWPGTLLLILVELVRKHMSVCGKKVLYNLLGCRQIKPQNNPNVLDNSKRLNPCFTTFYCTTFFPRFTNDYSCCIDNSQVKFPCGLGVAIHHGRGSLAAIWPLTKARRLPRTRETLGGKVVPVEVPLVGLVGVKMWMFYC